MIKNILRIKFFFLFLFIFLMSCINVGKTKYEDKVIFQKNNGCKVKVTQKNNKILNQIVCEDGYKITIPEFTYDIQNCKIKPYAFANKNKLYRKYELSCLDFDKKNYVQIF